MFCTRNVDGEIYVYVNMHVGTVVNMYCVSSSLIAKICRSHAFSNTVVESKEETHLDLMGNLSKESNRLKKQGVKVQHGLGMQYHGYSFRERSSLWILGMNSAHMHWLFQRHAMGVSKKSGTLKWMVYSGKAY